MSFFSNIVGATVKVALSPVAVVKDVVNVAVGEKPEETKELIQSALDDVEEAIDDITGVN